MCSNETKIGLSDEQRSSFETNGYLVIDRLLDDDDLRPLELEYEQLLNQVTRQLYDTGKISSTYEGLAFGERFARVLADYPDIHTFFNISLPLINGPVEAEHYHVHTGPAVFALLRNRKVLDVVECLIGPEIASSPVQQMRMKPPQQALASSNAEHSNVGLTTWHQDIVAILPEADETKQLTVWIAIREANEETGCLVSAPGSHRHGPTVHCPGELLASEPHVPTALMDEWTPTPLPVQRGGIILFHKFNIHCSLPNRSDKLRWSVDLRYHPIGQASGRPAFPGFVARSRNHPESELRDPIAWARLWEQARARIVSGQYHGPIFAEARWSDSAVC